MSNLLSIGAFGAFFGCVRPTVGSNDMKSTRGVLGHLLLRSLVRTHRSLIRLLRTARFARALRCAHSLARSLTRSLRSSWECDLCLWNECVDFIQVETTVHSLLRSIFAGITYSFACSRVLASLAHSAARILPFASSLTHSVALWNAGLCL